MPKLRVSQDLLSPRFCEHLKNLSFKLNLAENTAELPAGWRVSTKGALLDRRNRQRATFTIDSVNNTIDTIKFHLCLGYEINTKWENALAGRIFKIIDNDAKETLLSLHLKISKGTAPNNLLARHLRNLLRDVLDQEYPKWHNSRAYWD